MTTKPMSKAETRGRAKQAEFLYTAAFTLRMYGRPELGDEIAHLAAKIADGELECIVNLEDFG